MEKTPANGFTKLVWTISFIGILALLILGGVIYKITRNIESTSEQSLKLLTLSGENPCAYNNSSITEISYAVAKTYINNYLNTKPAPGNQVVRALSIDKIHYMAVNNMFLADNTLKGFRLYYGIDNNNTQVLIIVGVKSDGNNDENKVYMTPRGTSGLCPPICDIPKQADF